MDTLVLTADIGFTEIECRNLLLKDIVFESKKVIREINLYNNEFDSLCFKEFPNLTSIISENNTTPAKMILNNLPNLIHLQSVQDKLISIDINNAPNLKYLYLEKNNIENIDINHLININMVYILETKLRKLKIDSLKKLHTLFCNLNKLDSLQVTDLPLITELDCSNNQISKLNLSNLPSITQLNCQHNNLETLIIKNCLNLQNLDCSNNLINNLIDSLPNLKNLKAFNNQLSKLTLGLYPNVNFVYCQNNKISDTLNLINHSKLILFDCSYNNINNINLLNLNLFRELRCGNNSIDKMYLEGIPNMNRIYCNNNSFKELTLHNLKLELLDISNNKDLKYLKLESLPKLKSIFNLNTPLEFVISKDQWVFENSTNLYNGAEPIYNPNLKYICCSDKNITAIKSKLNSLGIQNCEVNSYCTFTPGSIFYSLIGNTIFDVDNNGCDSNDVKIPNVKFTITGGTESGTLIANSSGSYFFPFQTGTHTIQPSLENQTHFTVNPTSYILSPPFSQNQYIQDFCFTPKDVISNIDLSISPKSPPARPGFNAQYSIVITNTGNQIENGIINFEFEVTKMDFVSSDLAPTNQSDESLSWNYIDLLPYETRKFNVEFRINSPFDNPPINAGDELVFSCNTTNHDFTLKQIVVGSYDPNDKTCLQGNAITPEMVGDYVHYMIRFENTGNYAAENIVVKDVIDTSKFDVSSLQITDSSHEAWARIKGNVVEFIFEKIELPFNDEENDGYITFKIKTKPNLDLGAELKNEANIYFDYNLPVLTNEAKTVVAIPDLIHDETETAHFEVFPNPTANTVGYLSSDLVYKAEVFSIDGRLLQSSLFPGNEIEVKHLPDGSYVLKIYTRNKVQVGRFVIE
ncbi:MAG: T9SS type A sorting domain-containing protein [Saprospiraceae bacterium]|nr:T9SS type A sorting domain-containing protein [Saprospiraceae bacterium]